MCHFIDVRSSRFSMLVLVGCAAACGGAVVSKESSGVSGSDHAAGTSDPGGNESNTPVGAGSSPSSGPGGYAGAHSEPAGHGGQGGQGGSECPQSVPVNGTACATDGQLCVYGGACGPTFQCISGQWIQQSDPCGLPKPIMCPVDRPIAGMACDPTPDSCGYPDTYCGDQESGYTKYWCQRGVWVQLASNPGNCPNVTSRHTPS
jgi:hypothetical protein